MTMKSISDCLNFIDSMILCDIKKNTLVLEIQKIYVIIW